MYLALIRLHSVACNILLCMLAGAHACGMVMHVVCDVLCVQLCLQSCSLAARLNMRSWWSNCDTVPSSVGDMHA
jgi:hypothetical protein